MSPPNAGAPAKAPAAEPDPSDPRETSVDALLERYRGFLLDAYGVLVDATGPLPGAARLIERLEAGRRPWMVVTNDASRSPETCAKRYQALGLPVPADRVVTSGSLLKGHFERSALTGTPCLVLGPPDSHAYVTRAGAIPVGPDRVDFEETASIVIGDESGFDTLTGLDVALSLAYARRERGRRLALILPNPDLVYPKRPGHFGLAAGSLAVMLESALELRWPGAAENRFVRLGKPSRALFDEATARLGTRDVVMIGDQPATDIAGARAAGLDAALVMSGVGRLGRGQATPTYILSTLETT